MSHDTRTPKRRSRYYIEGYLVAIGLAVLTALEYYVAVSPWSSTILLFILAIFKAALVINYFMHMRSLWTTEEEH